LTLYTHFPGYLGAKRPKNGSVTQLFFGKDHKFSNNMSMLWALTKQLYGFAISAL